MSRHNDTVAITGIQIKRNGERGTAQQRPAETILGTLTSGQQKQLLGPLKTSQHKQLLGFLTSDQRKTY